MHTGRTKSVTELFGLPDPPKTGRERLVAAAVDLFYRHGFGAVGIERVIEAAGVTKTTFYKHFEGKDDLMVAAVRRRDEWESQAWGRAVRAIAGERPAGQFLAMLDVMDVWFNDSDFRGCMFANTAAEFPNPHDPVHQAAAEYKRRTRDSRRDLARAAGADEAGAEAFADCFTALVEGALVLRQIFGRNDAARVVRPAVELLISTCEKRRCAAIENRSWFSDRLLGIVGAHKHTTPTRKRVGVECCTLAVRYFFLAATAGASRCLVLAFGEPGPTLFVGRT